MSTLSALQKCRLFEIDASMYDELLKNNYETQIGEVMTGLVEKKQCFKQIVFSQCFFSVYFFQNIPQFFE